MPTSDNNEDLFTIINDIFNDKIPFNKVLGIRVLSLSYNQVKLIFEMREELIGNYMRKTLHGGVISSAVDVTGGLAAFMGMQQRADHENLQSKLEKFGKLATIDLRVDYLRPGMGTYFVSTGYSLRTGRKLAVSRIELHNDTGLLIAAGTGSYTIS